MTQRAFGITLTVVFAIWMAAALHSLYATQETVRGVKMPCKFDRNEPGPQGWWWDVYKCADGTQRRQLVASPRG